MAFAAFIPMLSGLSDSRVFYIRDLSLFFWSRHLWLRRTLLGGEWPLWDPYVGGGQSAVADALHQMFLLPVLAIRLLGSEVVSFNLWVALPFPCAAVGAWQFLRYRVSAPAATIGALAFALSGPVISTGNFPNMSWSVAAMPWVLWAVERLLRDPGARRAVPAAVIVALQALAGEPVTFATTSALAVGLSAFVAGPDDSVTLHQRLRAVTWTTTALLLGASLAAIQLMPMVHAASIAERSQSILKDAWSLHPVALVETIALHLFGNYFTSQSLSGVPWISIVNVGREPFFFSLYYGVPLFALALFGMVALGGSRWGVFWAAAGGASILLAFGVHTPVYPFLRDHVPILASFRFPVKYLVAFSMAVAVGAAAGWDALADARNPAAPRPALARARLDAVLFAIALGLIALALGVASKYWPAVTADRAAALAKAIIGGSSSKAGEFMPAALIQASVIIVPLAAATAILLFVAARASVAARFAAPLLFVLIAGDLIVRAQGINPVFDAKYLAEPEWLARTRADPDARFYVGGKRDGTLDIWDIDSPRGFFNPPGLIGSKSRAALNGQTAFYPSAWKGREMLSYDLAVLWPHTYDVASQQFFEADHAERDRFLDRTGVRYRVLPQRLSGGRQGLVDVPYYAASSLYDWGTDVAARVSVVPLAKVVADQKEQIDALFAPGWDIRQVVIVDRESEQAGVRNDNGTGPSAKIVTEGANRMTIEATVPEGGGYLLALDSYSDDWTATVDGQAATLVRANGLFRAVRLTAGSHVVALTYRPRAFLWGAAVSAAAAFVCAMLLVRRRPQMSPQT